MNTGAPPHQRFTSSISSCRKVATTGRTVAKGGTGGGRRLGFFMNRSSCYWSRTDFWSPMAGRLLIWIKSWPATLSSVHGDSVRDLARYDYVTRVTDFGV